MPKDNPGLGPHKSLIDLSTIASGTTRLVTTNFDRVFQLALPDLQVMLPPNLLDPRRPAPWRGVVHLHGIVTPDYDGAAPGEFVVSSADFGRAYLADGWATTFMRALMERYRIVFVGYSADDPPIRYLLEALSRTSRPGRRFMEFARSMGGTRSRSGRLAGFRDFEGREETDCPIPVRTGNGRSRRLFERGRACVCSSGSCAAG
jgi:hypothetical protein